MEAIELRWGWNNQLKHSLNQKYLLVVVQEETGFTLESLKVLVINVMISSMSFPWRMITLEIEFCQLSISCHVKNPLPQDFCIFLEFLHSCGHPWLWNAVSSELTGLDHESFCHSVAGGFVLYFIKLNMKIIPVFISTDSCHRKAYVSELKILFMYKLRPKTLSENSLRSVEVEDSVLWHLSRGKTK